MRSWVILLMASFLSFAGAEARIQRSSVERHAFVKEHACPATGRHRLPCPGWQIDHVRALCAGGPDFPGNMQWLTIEDHKTKTRADVRACRNLRKFND